MIQHCKDCAWEAAYDPLDPYEYVACPYCGSTDFLFDTSSIWGDVDEEEYDVPPPPPAPITAGML